MRVYTSKSISREYIDPRPIWSNHVQIKVCSIRITSSDLHLHHASIYRTRVLTISGIDRKENTMAWMRCAPHPYQSLRSDEWPDHYLLGSKRAQISDSHVLLTFPKARGVHTESVWDKVDVGMHLHEVILANKRKHDRKWLIFWKFLSCRMPYYLNKIQNSFCFLFFATRSISGKVRIFRNIFCLGNNGSWKKLPCVFDSLVKNQTVGKRMF